MRLFIAIELEEDIREQLITIQNQLRMNISKGNFTPRNNFHLTLHFLGETDKEIMFELQRVLDEVACNHTAFTLSLNVLGHFSKKQKEVIWAGVKGQTKLLNELKTDLEYKLGQVGLPVDKQKFTPHITLIRNARVEASFESIQHSVKVPNTVIFVKSLSLMESIRIEDKLVYRPLYIRNFKEC